MAVQAVANGIRLSPRKVGEVAALVRGRTVADALVILDHTPRRAAKPLSKVIASAQANAKNNHNLDPKQLQIERLEIGPGPSLKRFRPAAHGRAQGFLRRTTNIRVVVTGPERAARKPAAAKKSETPATEEETK